MPASLSPWMHRLDIVGRWVLSTLIVYAFLVAVMTASAQQRVTAVLDQRPDRPSYSSALTKVKAFEQAKKDLETLRAEETQARDRERELQNVLDQSRLDIEEAWSRISGVAARARGFDGCLPTEALGPLSDPATRNTLWTAVIDCASAANSTLPAALRKEIEVKAEGEVNFGKAYAAYQRAVIELSQAQAMVKRHEEDAVKKQKDVDDAAELSATFDDTLVLRKSPVMVAGAWLVDFPPSLLQLLLAFAAGLFGALLVTTVIVVYPNHAFAQISAGQKYYSRLLLGGLIALGAYVILGGGTAILGNTNPFGQSQPNFMTFCAVGVLAGMFSDRVADFFSRNADAFFKRLQESDEDKTADKADAPPPPADGVGGKPPPAV